MPAPSSIDDLLKLIRKSGMVDEPRLITYLEQLKLSGNSPLDVRKLAGSMVKDGILTYFQAEQFMLGKWRGFTIGKYKLLERIGFGGMGQVFLCEHMYMRRRVAIKVLPPAKAEEPASLGRFYREARAAAALDHPNIVRTHDIDQDGNLHFLVMEYVEGSSLLEMVKKTGPLSVERAINYIWQSAAGLDHAYRVGVIHRDIKPGNILVDRWGVSKILDMGLARFYHTDDDMLTLKYDEKSVLGTADYVAPEQTVNSHDVDVQADIYSLGCTFYFLLAGHPPFPDGTIAQKLICHQTKVPRSIQEIRPEVPDEIAAILNQMLAKSIEERFLTPQDVSDAMMPYVQTQIPPPPEEEMPILSRAARECLASASASGSMSGSFRQDSAILRSELMQQRSGKFHQSSSSARIPSGGGGGGEPLGGGRGHGSSGQLRRPYYEPPPTQTGGTGPKTGRPMHETKRMAETTDRTPLGDPDRPMARPAKADAAELARQRRNGLFGSPVRIMIEAILIFFLFALLWYVFWK